MTVASRSDRLRPLWAQVGRWWIALDEDAQAVLLAVAVGLVTAIAGIAFHTAFTLLGRATGLDGNLEPGATISWWWVVLVPGLGGLAVGLLRRWLDPGGEGFGVGRVVESLAANEGAIAARRTVLAGVGAVITLGTGGSAGPEGPIVEVGGGIGSSIGTRLGSPGKLRQVLVGCGAAAGIATLFNAPIGAVLFVIEVITEGFGVLSVGPILIAAVTATATRHFLLGDEPPFGELSRLGTLGFGALPAVVALGLASGYIGRALLVGWLRAHRAARRLPGPTWLRPAVGGLVAGAIGVAHPAVLGTGYPLITEVLASPVNFGVFLLAFVFLAKAVATGATLTTGGAGGVFAPSLVLGVLLGVATGHLFAFDEREMAILGILGMAGVMSAVLHCPMTALLLVFELTRNYGLILPAMAVAVTATWISRRSGRHSIFLMELAERGGYFRRGSDKAVLAKLEIVDLIETDALAVREDATFDEVLDVVKSSTRNFFPVLGANEELLGMIYLNDLRAHMFEPELRHLVRARDLMHTGTITVSLDEAMDRVLAKLDATGAWSLPVVFLGRYRGMISRSRLQGAYRAALIRETQV